MQHISEIATQVRADIPAEVALYVGFPDCVVKVLTGGGALHAELVDYFHEFPAEGPHYDILVTVHEGPSPDMDEHFTVKEPDPGKSKIKEEYLDIPGGRVVRKRLTGMYFFFGGGDNIAVGPCAENPNQVVNFVNNRYIEKKLNAGCLLGHAAGVCKKGIGLGLAGFSGAGKSTLALHLTAAGVDFVSNDRLLVTKSGAGVDMFGVAKHPRINPGTALSIPELTPIMSENEKTRFSAMPQAGLWDLEDKYDAVVEKLFGPGRFQLASPMQGLVILNWKRGAGPASARVVPVAEADTLLPAFMKAAGLFYIDPEGREISDPGMDEYKKELAELKLLEISGGADFEYASKLCLDFLESGDWKV
jgi:HprK-related kinase B